MKNIPLTIHPDLVEQLPTTDYTTLVEKLAKVEASILDDKEMTAFQRNTLISHNAHQQALVAEYFEDIKSAYHFIQKAHHHHAYQRNMFEDVIRIALTFDTKESRDLVYEVAEHLFCNDITVVPYSELWYEETMEKLFERVSPEDYGYVEYNDDAYKRITTLLDKTAEQYPDFKAFSYLRTYHQLKEKKENGEAIGDAIYDLFEAWEKEGVGKHTFDYTYSCFCKDFRPDQYLIEHWENRDEDLAKIRFTTIYMKVWETRFLNGAAFPETIHLPESSNADTLYSAATTGLFSYNDLEERDLEKSEPAQNILKLSLLIGERAFSLFQAVENGEVNGKSNEVHTYAMLCRNLANLNLYYYGEEKRSLELSELGFQLSPFIENGYSMVRLACDLKQYERALANLATVRSVIKDADDERRGLAQYEFYCLAHLERLEDYLEKQRQYWEREYDFFCLFSIDDIEGVETTPVRTPKRTDYIRYLKNTDLSNAYLLKLYPEHPQLLALELQNLALTAYENDLKRYQTRKKSIQKVLKRTDLDPETKFLITFNDAYLSYKASEKEKGFLKKLLANTVQKRAISQMQKALEEAPKNDDPVWQLKLNRARLITQFCSSIGESLPYSSEIINTQPHNLILDNACIYKIYDEVEDDTTLEELDKLDHKTIHYEFGLDDAGEPQLIFKSNVINTPFYLDSLSWLLSYHPTPNYLLAEAYILQANVNIIKENPAEALPDLRMAWRLNPLNKELVETLIDCLNEVGGDKTEITVLEKWLEIISKEEDEETNDEE